MELLPVRILKLGKCLKYHPLSPEDLVVRLAAIVDSSDDAIIGTDIQGTIITWNPAATALFGFQPAEILGESILLLIPPDLHEEQAANWEKLRQDERIDHYETPRLRKGGDRVGISMSMSPIRNADGELIGSAVIARSLSARQQEETAISRLAAIVESSDDAIVAKDLNGVVTAWNAAAERLFGYTASEMIGRSILTIIPPDLQHEEPMILGKIRAGERVQHYETQRLHKSGKRIDVSLSMSPIRDRGGRVVGASKVARDASEQKKLASARLMLAAIVESSDDAIISKNLDGIITSWNAAAERLLGYKPEEIIGQSVLRIIPRELHGEEPRIIKKLKNGERIDHHETRRIKKNGEVVEVSLTISPIRDQHGRVVGGSKILHDIRDRRLAEVALLEKERFAAAGRLAATLAHEVNNPLESITNLAYLLTENTSLDEEARRFAELLLKEVQRAGDITRQTLGYYRESKIPADVNLTQVIEHVIKGKQRKLEGKNIELTVAMEEQLIVKGFHGELRQVFENLIDNAIDAVPQNGQIQVRGRTEDNNGNNRVVMSVSDNGPGIAPSQLSNLFEPFFTTKADKGSGLGLWVSRSIVQKHGGTIRLTSNQNGGGAGTEFTLEIPVEANVRSGATAYSSISTHSARV
jgi:PAS domain S-box-containing protein